MQQKGSSDCHQDKFSSYKIFPHRRTNCCAVGFFLHLSLTNLLLRRTFLDHISSSHSYLQQHAAFPLNVHHFHSAAELSSWTCHTNSEMGGNYVFYERLRSIDKQHDQNCDNPAYVCYKSFPWSQYEREVVIWRGRVKGINNVCIPTASIPMDAGV